MIIFITALVLTAMCIIIGFSGADFFRLYTAALIGAVVYRAVTMEGN